MDHVIYKRILRILETENRWLTFDELYSKAQCDWGWTDFALQLERLVEQEEVEYMLLSGEDIGCYRIKERVNDGYQILGESQKIESGETPRLEPKEDNDPSRSICYETTISAREALQMMDAETSTGTDKLLNWLDR